MAQITSYSAAGRVTTGFSKPYVAKYNENGGEVTFTNARVLARGVSVEVTPDESSDNNFHADNQLAESAAGTFTGGTITLTVDGLHEDAEKFIMGNPSRGADGWVGIGDSQSIPNVATAYIVRYMCAGVVLFRPEIIVKTKYNQLGQTANTQGEDIEYQTQELSGVIMRGDDANHNWKLLGNDWSTEAEAEAELVAKLGGVSTFHSVTQNLTNVASSYYPSNIADGEDLAVFLTPDAGYTISSVEVKVNNVDVTADTYNADQGAVVIKDVDHDVVITATAAQ